MQKLLSKLGLIHMDSLKKMIECSLVSPYIKDEKPISLLIIAKPESGKTQVMKTYGQNKGIELMTDCTAYGIEHHILPKIQSGEIRTLMIPDLLTPLSKSTRTRQSLIACLNALVEEGIIKVRTYTTIWDTPVSCNIITAITDEALEDGRHDWAKLGFLSRFIVFTYDYDFSTIASIFERYYQRPPYVAPEIINMPKKTIDIELNPDFVRTITPLAVKIASEFGLYGFRSIINFRSLLKSLAYLNGKKEVTEDELKEFYELANYMNFKYNPLR